MAENKITEIAMPKTYNNIFNKIYEWGNLILSFKQASKNRRYSGPVLEYKMALEENLVNTQNHLIWGSWHPGSYKYFTVYEPKERLIMAPPFCDRIVHHAIVNIIEPLLEKKFIFDSYACRVGKGIHRAAYRSMYFLRCAKRMWGKSYILKADISKYFPSIDSNVLVGIIKKTIRDKKTLSLCERIISHGAVNGKGLPVGALTSQLFANTYLDQLDHYAKDQLGLKYYLRYMDDWVVVGPAKNILREYKEQMENFISKNLQLRLNKKTDIFPASHGVDFCGYRIWDTHILPRKRNVKRARRRLFAMAKKYHTAEIGKQKLSAVLASFAGYMKHCAGEKTVSEILNKINKKTGDSQCQFTFKNKIL